MTCRAQQRRDADRLANRLAMHPAVAGVDVLSPEVGPRTSWTIEATLDREGVPQGTLVTLGSLGATVLDVSRQGDGTRLIVTV